MDDFPLRPLEKDEFPELLHEIPDPPEALFVRGALPPAGNKILTVVGSREHSSYGRQATEALVKGLVGYPISIISGLALGIDAIAHRAALDAGLHTMAVLGTGITNAAIYPRRNISLAKEILSAGGGILGEYGDAVPVTRWAFPRRNRIKAGMSHAVLIIEAGEKSGTLITARLAMEYNREVLTVPGSIFSQGSFGPQILIKEGATPATTSNDIVEALGLRTQETVATPTFVGTEPEMKLLTLLIDPMQKDALIALSGMPAHEANVTLSLLELKSAIREDNGVLTRVIAM
jgi:DNA processing protein